MENENKTTETTATQQELPNIVPEVEEWKGKFAEIEKKNAELASQLSKFLDAEKETKKQKLQKAQEENKWDEVLKAKDEELNQKNTVLSELQTKAQQVETYNNFVQSFVTEELKALPKEEIDIIKSSPFWDKSDPLKQAEVIKYHKSIRPQKQAETKPNPFHSGGLPQGQKDVLSADLLKKGDVRGLAKLAASSMMSKFNIANN